MQKSFPKILEDLAYQIGELKVTVNAKDERIYFSRKFQRMLARAGFKYYNLRVDSEEKRVKFLFRKTP